MFQTATTIIAELKKIYTGNRTELDFYTTSYTTGENKKHLRQEIIYKVTGKRLPLTQCTDLKVSEVLKNSFDQLTIF